MNIEYFRSVAKIEPNQFVLHIGEQNLKYWLDSYKNSRFGKVFWTSPKFYTRGYDISSLEQATVTSYQNPWYYFVRCRIKSDDNLTTCLDDSYAADLDFRFSFDTTKVKALVIDEDTGNRENIKLFLDNAKTLFGFLNPDVIYVRNGLDYMIDDFAASHNLQPMYMFEVNQGNTSCTYHAYIRDKK